MHACFALQRALYNQSHKDDCFFEFTFVSPVACKTTCSTRATCSSSRPSKVRRANALLHKTGNTDAGQAGRRHFLLRAQQINVAPINDVVGSIVLGMDRSNVDSVFHRRQRGQASRPTGGVDVERVVRKADEARERYWHADRSFPPRLREG